MSVKTRRSYNSPQRTEQAGATRQHILAAAEALFADRGYGSVTMETIARRASVSVATVYLHFPGKPAIVAAMAEAIAGAPELSVEQVERSTDPIEQLRLGARIIRTLNERVWLVADILRNARGNDERLTEIWTLWQQRHADAIRRAVESAHALGALRAGLAVDEAIDGLYALMGTDLFRALVRERGWGLDRYERWLFRMSCIELFGVLPDDDSAPYAPA
jgi:AcrR family transcriptional regulator